MARGNNLDRNTILTLNKDPNSIDLHNMALARMKNVKVDPTARQDFIEDRARGKNIKNIDELYEKLNELERNGVLDIWIKKFGKKKYLKENLDFLNSIEIDANILEESNKMIIEFSRKFIEEIAGGISGGISGGAIASSVGSPIATMGAQPQKNKKIMQKNKYPKPTLGGDTDIKLSKRQ